MWDKNMENTAGDMTGDKKTRDIPQYCAFMCDNVIPKSPKRTHGAS